MVGFNGIVIIMLVEDVLMMKDKLEDGRNIAGPKGRFRNNLISLILKNKKKVKKLAGMMNQSVLKLDRHSNIGVIN